MPEEPTIVEPRQSHYEGVPAVVTPEWYDWNKRNNPNFETYKGVFDQRLEAWREANDPDYKPPKAPTRAEQKAAEEEEAARAAADAEEPRPEPTPIGEPPVQIVPLTGDQVERAEAQGEGEADQPQEGAQPSAKSRAAKAGGDK